MNNYFIAHKPYHVLSQFSSEDGKLTLKDFFNVPPNVYPVGRLDYDSEGLLLLTDDKKLNKLLLDPTQKHEREYWVQVEGIISEVAINELQQGVFIQSNGKKYFYLRRKSWKEHRLYVLERTFLIAGSVWF